MSQDVLFYESLIYFQVQFIESDWYVGTTQGRRPSSSEMVAVLSTLQSIHIRAKWTTFTDKQTRIADINMKFSKNGSSGKKAFNVETCICPKQYVGQFCERCAPGYTRATPNVCSGCQHNTTGMYRILSLFIDIGKKRNNITPRVCIEYCLYSLILVKSATTKTTKTQSKRMNE